LRYYFRSKRESAARAVWDYPHVRRRNFDVMLSEFAESDLVPMAQEARIQVVKVLERLRDDDLHSCDVILGWPRDALGTWMFMTPEGSEWAFLCQFDRGTPDLWHLGFGRGTLTVQGITIALYAQQLLMRIPKVVEAS
jgi:hypothetical protein